MQKKKIPPEILKKILLFALLETAIAAVLVAVDLLSKHFVFQNVGLSEEIKTLGGFLTITALKNTGASFGIFGSSTAALTIVSFVCSLLIFAFSVYTERTRTPLLRAALVLVLAGAVGNLADRFVLGYVRDFIQLSIFPWVFNVADSFLTVGVILLLIYVVFFYSRDKERADKRKAAEGAPNGALTAEGLNRPDAEEGDLSESEQSVESEKGGVLGSKKGSVPESKKSGVEAEGGFPESETEGVPESRKGVVRERKKTNVRESEAGCENREASDRGDGGADPA